MYEKSENFNSPRPIQCKKNYRGGGQIDPLPLTPPPSRNRVSNFFWNVMFPLYTVCFQNVCIVYTLSVSGMYVSLIPCLFLECIYPLYTVCFQNVCILYTLYVSRMYVFFIHCMFLECIYPLYIVCFQNVYIFYTYI